MAGRGGKPKVMIAAGGTGGHVFPGIALAEEIKRQAPESGIVFAGTDRGLEATIVPRRGWPLLMLPSSSIKDKSGARRIAAAALVPLSVARAAWLIATARPSLLIGIGGYAAGPLAVAAWLMRVPVVLVEPNAVPGLTNKSLRRFAKKIFVSFEGAAAAFGKKAILTGTPVRAEVLAARHGAADRGGRFTIFVFGGSQGAVRLNRGMVESLSELGGLRERIEIIHQTGTRDDSESIARSYHDAGIKAEVFAFNEKIWECYERADIVIARAGANTIAETTALGIPSLLVPYPHAADDHQSANARALEIAGGAAVVPDGEFTGSRAAREITALIGDEGRIESMRRGALGFGRPEAARVIARESLAVIGM